MVINKYKRVYLKHTTQRDQDIENNCRNYKLNELNQKYKWHKRNIFLSEISETFYLEINECFQCELFWPIAEYTENSTFSPNVLH